MQRSQPLLVALPQHAWLRRQRQNCCSLHKLCSSELGDCQCKKWIAAANHSCSMRQLLAVHAPVEAHIGQAHHN